MCERERKRERERGGEGVIRGRKDAKKGGKEYGEKEVERKMG